MEASETAKAQAVPPSPEITRTDKPEIEHPDSKSDPVSTSPKAAENSATDASSSNADRLARFRALQARAAKSAKANLKEATAESARLATDTSALTAISRKHAVASHNLLKADTEAAGEDFERKRAWDWTAEESERWDKRQAKKSRHREDVAFQDYTQEARKTYKRQVRDIEVDTEAYNLAKAEAVRKAAVSGGLELVENEDGEIVAIDKDGSFLGGGSDGTDFTQNKPSKEGIDRLVNNLKKAEEQRLKARKNRKGNDDPDVTYINEKNKQFNMKLARFYNKYTADIRESFERGTMI